MVTVNSLIKADYITPAYSKFKCFKTFINSIIPVLSKSTAKVYPEDSKNIFRAFKLVDPNNIKVVILGMDPYHDGSSTGIAFDNYITSKKISPSLRNVIKEMESDLDGTLKPTTDSYLGHLPAQGVLLINTALTVEKGKAGSHAALWSVFTRELIEDLNGYDNIIWVLWGNHAKAYKESITNTTHQFIESAHPSPFSAEKGFFGTKPFSKVNQLLKKLGKEEIKWLNTEIKK